MLSLSSLPLIKQSRPYTCGAACFASMFEYLKKESLSELFFAEKLQTLTLGYTPPENIAKLAIEYGLNAELLEFASIEQLNLSVENNDVVFVTWWDEDAGHYCLVKKMDAHSITLMDPLLDHDNHLTLEYFLPNWKIRGAKLISVSVSK